MRFTYTWLDSNELILKRTCLDTGTVVWVPVNSSNTDYQEYLAWLAEGNTPLPPDPIPEPEPLTPQQKLEAAGLTVEELRELLGL